MTTKRDKKDEPKAAKRPKLTQEKVKDLAADERAQAVKGGFRSAGRGAAELIARRARRHA